ncbi:terminase [Marinitoga sp. 1135]|uniref:Phage terminase, large subunit, PBSX family n=1 Tax=Marinitoga piezophila (strain DSM 14283 / JCM 11233 / KA3) TaxID=443254 RepID=H2J4B5_MARPK|nr:MULTISPECIES: PBSX family phage terminase large subunit [Marinitoga]AEX84770.1 phage terminase, large subunit, PBSX family [Marinitoga piezophila KA3]NUU94818.1 terminase [Marinitoga sp. 1135]
MILRIKHPEKIFNDVYFKNLKNTYGTQIYFGGASSGKSYFILGQRTILDVLTSNRNFLIVRNVARTNRHSTFNEVLKGIANFNLTDYFKINKSEMTITAFNGNQILFAGLDDVEKLKSITPAKGVITDIIIEEATEIRYDAFKQLTKRLRGKSDVKKRITLMFNPIYQTHWIYKEFFQGWVDDKEEFINKGRDLYILKTTYRNNKFLTADDIERIESETDPYYRDVYIEGNWGILGNVIFRNWKVEDTSKYNFDRYINGLDFGFANDPAAFVRMSFDRKRNRLFILDEIYATGLDNEELAKLIKEKIGSELVTCDSAEPKSIQELRKYGVNARGAKKGKGSLETGYKFLQKLEIIIDPKCQNTINEFTVHKWKENKNGEALPIPEDKDNHAIDAIRYGIEDEIIENTYIEEEMEW